MLPCIEEVVVLRLPCQEEVCTLLCCTPPHESTATAAYSHPPQRPFPPSRMGQDLQTEYLLDVQQHLPLAYGRRQIPHYSASGRGMIVGQRDQADSRQLVRMSRVQSLQHSTLPVCRQYEADPLLRLMVQFAYRSQRPAPACHKACLTASAYSVGTKVTSSKSLPCSGSSGRVFSKPKRSASSAFSPCGALSALV